jgi:3-hydroxy-3-methylglutaryl CoA synthase/NAD(P)-dependent dehydrogenase (short-subunit alcohol dehydrogenase family)/putative sterol carrier protein
MVGIVSYGGYIPRLRLDRMSVFQNMGWFAPAIVMVAQGERSFCNHDEDSLTMAVAAGKDCLVGVDKSTVDAAYLASTTLPFQDRCNAGIQKTALNLRDNLVAQDFTSCLKAGTSSLITALSAVKGGEVKNVLVTATDKRETKTAYFYEMWFGDGAASVLVGDKDPIAEFLGSHSVSHDFVDHYRGLGNQFDYMWEERWVRDQGYSKIIPEAVNGLFEKLSITMEDVDKFVFPCFFKAEHRKIAAGLGATPEKVPDNMHEVCGETGAAHPMVMLVRALEEAEPGDRILVCGFGQGCDALYFKVTDKIKEMAARKGIKGSLANKKIETNHSKFLKFRELLPTEMGIRAEAPTQTAMSTLWRKRDMILGLVGGKCEKCGTPQFPRMDICVNPECVSVGTQVPYEFADRIAKVKTYTSDLLSVSVDPPAMYGMVQFEGGGRFMADFADCVFEDVYVGQPCTLSFRRRYTDKGRGFSGYFWKAVPIPGEKPKAKKATGPKIEFEGRVAIITGAGAGLGRVYAIEMAKRGAKVVVNDLGVARDGTGSSQNAADKVVDEIKAAGGEAIANYDSVSTVEGGQAIVDAAVDAFGKVDIVINNAGILRDKTLAKMDTAEWKGVLDVHLHGAYHVTRPAFAKMRENGYGRIVMTTSAAGLHGNFGQTNYGAAKMGLVGFTNTLKIEGERHDIKVNVIAPLAATRLTEDIFPPDMLEKLQPDYVAPIVLYFASEGCVESGSIVNAGAGFFGRSAILTGPGAVVGDGKSVPTVEQVAAKWDEINSMDGAEEYPNATAALGAMMSAFTPKAEKPAAKESGGGASVQTVFDKLPSAFVADAAAGVDVVFQFSLSGDDGGEWHAIIKDQTCTVESGTHASPTTTIIMSAPDFVDLIQGRLNAMKAYTGGQLKIGGDLMKSQLIEKLFKF